MKQLIAKIICAILGHKQPEIFKNQPIIQCVTGSVNGYHYSWSKMACERCYAFEKLERFTPEEWYRIVQKSNEKYVQAIEAAQREIEKELELDDSEINAKIPSKMVH